MIIAGMLITIALQSFYPTPDFKGKQWRVIYGTEWLIVSSYHTSVATTVQ